MCVRPTLQAGNGVEGEEREQGDQTTDPGLPDRHGTSSAGHSSAFHRVGGGDLPPSVHVTTSVGVDVVEHDVYYEDKLFCLRASLRGPAGQLLWDLNPKVTLADSERLLRKRFGNADQTERFRTELQTLCWREGESLQRLFSDVCRLMSLVYPGPKSDLSDVVGRDAFLEASVRILERVPTTMEEALRIALNLEGLDMSREMEVKALAGSQDHVVEEPRRKDGYPKVVAKSVSTPTVGGKPVETTSTLAEVSQLKEALGQCVQQLQQLQSSVVHCAGGLSCYC